MAQKLSVLFSPAARVISFLTMLLATHTQISFAEKSQINSDAYLMGRVITSLFRLKYLAQNEISNRNDLTSSLNRIDAEVLPLAQAIEEQIIPKLSSNHSGKVFACHCQKTVHFLRSSTRHIYLTARSRFFSSQRGYFPLDKIYAGLSEHSAILLSVVTGMIQTEINLLTATDHLDEKAAAVTADENKFNSDIQAIQQWHTFFNGRRLQMIFQAQKSIEHLSSERLQDLDWYQHEVDLLTSLQSLFF